MLPGDRNYSYSDGDQGYEWSPDGRWLAVQFLSPGRWSSEVGLVSASGEGKLINVTQSGYEDELPHWARKGEVLYWRTRPPRACARSELRPRRSDIFAAFLTRAAWDRYQLDEAAYDQLDGEGEGRRTRTRTRSKEQGRGKDKSAKAEDAPKLPSRSPWTSSALEDRIVRLSMQLGRSGRRGAVAATARPSYYLARFEKGYDLWKYVPRKKEIKLVAKLERRTDADLQARRQGQEGVRAADGKLLGGGARVRARSTPVGLSAPSWTSTRRPSAPTCSSTSGGRRSKKF